MNQFLSVLGTRLGRAAADRQRVIAAPSLDEAMAASMLELAAVVAHGQERRFAPLACYMIGVAVGRMTAAFPDVGSAELLGYVRTVREGIEADSTAPDSRSGTL
jgi:hypothetical protein